MLPVFRACTSHFKLNVHIHEVTKTFCLLLYLILHTGVCGTAPSVASPRHLFRFWDLTRPSVADICGVERPWVTRAAMRTCRAMAVSGCSVYSMTTSMSLRMTSVTNTLHTSKGMPNCSPAQTTRPVLSLTHVWFEFPSWRMSLLFLMKTVHSKARFTMPNIEQSVNLHGYQSLCPGAPSSKVRRGEGEQSW